MIRNKISGSFYIGSSVNIHQRWAAHRCCLRQNKAQSRILQNAWNSYGEEAFEFSVVELCERSKVIEREQYWIDELRPKYNIAPLAGSTLGARFSDEVNQKKGRPKTVYAVDGVTGSLKKLCKHFKVVTATGAAARLEKGASIEHAVKGVPMEHCQRGKEAVKAWKKHPRAKLYEFRGETLTFDVLVSKYSKVSVYAVKARLARGWDLEAALTTDYVAVEDRKQRPKSSLDHYKAKPLTVRGFTGTVVDIAKKFSVSEHMLRNRLSKGWPPEEAVFTPKHKGRASIKSCKQSEETE